ncbi:hypothetical protein HYDPIDRAFT_98718 [Hydnomerulius pinastri MD-312]|uniref:Unplaced genomic scaffold scaffold_38, whole genome shotgun sequence n=1 Tax=Hydnomerulius pinastri MD-312 TaxID=994086 RepID=A0A0C9V4J6_9AGAM|nr:hypothetical protein HYDPIDRAFT_98718 [Hydnomerulius pinastri MD-312]
MASQAAASAVLDSVTIKILHAHSFARTSSQASSVLSNLLSRYLILVASACGQYAELAGRSRLSVHDLLACLGELGTNMDELSEYCSTEGVELSRYASSSAKRLDDLADIRGYLGEGLAHEDDAIPLTYAPLPEDELEVGSEEDEVEEASEDEVMEDGDAVPSATADMFAEPASYRWHPTSPYTPDFLPPFPDASRPQSPSPTPTPHPIKMERPPSPLPQHIASATAADYVTQVPYTDSVLATTPQWHLPSQPPSLRKSRAQTVRFPTPSTQQALLSAYHHILTHPVSQPGPPNPAKHKVALALVSQVQTNTRWDVPETLYANIVPCPPRVTAIGPSYAIPHSALEDIRAGKDVEKELEKKSLLPAAPPRPVFSNDRPVFLASQQSSRIPELARQVLPGSVLARTSRLTHPPILQRGSQKLYYGSGVPAPWNSSPFGASGAQGGKGGDDSNSMANGREAPSFTLPDAQMFATWEYEAKHCQEPLFAGRRGRTSGLASGTPTLSLSLGRPSKATS